MRRKYSGEDLFVFAEIARRRKQYMEDLHVEKQADLTPKQMIDFVNQLRAGVPGFNRLVQKKDIEEGLPVGPERYGDFN